MPVTPNFTTYSFSDYTIIFSNPNIGSQSLNGQGVGQLTVTWPNDNTTTDTGADGAVMMGKQINNISDIAISIQQTSEVDKWFRNLFNILYALNSDQWATSKITIETTTGAEVLRFKNVAFKKRSERPYDAQPQRISWNFVGIGQDVAGAVIGAISTVSAKILNG